LRSWKPRQPSARIKARLFPSSVQTEPEVSLPSLWSWLAPAMAVGLLTAMVLPKDARGFGTWQGGPPTGLVASVALDSPHLVSYVASMRHSAWNAWPGASFEWTNEAASRTTAPPFLQTNGIIQ